jgi:Glycosyltransferase family 9 (heptosyltransferase)
VSNLEFPLWAEDFNALGQIEGIKGLDTGPYACIHPGASVPERRWPLEVFTATARFLGKRGMQVVVTGTDSERCLAEALARSSGVSAVNVAGRTSLGALAALISRARVLVCNDTSVAHLSEALRVPSVVLSTGNNPDRWGPLDRCRHRVLCPAGGFDGDQVIGQLEELLHVPETTRAQPGSDPSDRTVRRSSARLMAHGKEEEMAAAEAAMVCRENSGELP